MGCASACIVASLTVIILVFAITTVVYIVFHSRYRKIEVKKMNELAKILKDKANIKMVPIGIVPKKVNKSIIGSVSEDNTGDNAVDKFIATTAKISPQMKAKINLNISNDWATQFETKQNVWGTSDNSVHYLDRHNVKCPTGTALNNFRFGTSHVANIPNGKVNYFYRCNKDTHKSTSSKTTKAIADGGGKYVSGLLHNVDCAPNGVIKEFTLARPSGNKTQYKYVCGNHGKGKLQCNTKVTPWTSTVGSKNIGTLSLGNLYVKCEPHEAIGSFKTQISGPWCHGKKGKNSCPASSKNSLVRYEYKCCSAENDKNDKSIPFYTLPKCEEKCINSPCSCVKKDYSPFRK